MVGDNGFFEPLELGKNYIAEAEKEYKKECTSETKATIDEENPLPEGVYVSSFLGRSSNQFSSEPILTH